MRNYIAYLLFWAIVLSTGCGTRNTHTDIGKSQTEVKQQSEKTEKQEQGGTSVNRSTETNQSDQTEKETVKEVKEKFDNNGNLTERTTTETQRDKTDKRRIEKNSEKYETYYITKTLTINKLVIVKETIKEKSKVVDADKTVATNVGGWSIIALGIVVVALLCYYLKKIRI